MREPLAASVAIEPSEQSKALKCFGPDFGPATTIKLSGGYAALIDLADFDRVSQFKWSATTNEWGGVYGMRRDGSKAIYLHRFIVGAEPGEQVDHRDGDGLNCCKANLRHCTQSQNNMNRRKQKNPSSSRFKGVTLRDGKRWQAKLRLNRKDIVLGRFTTEEAAARAYDAAALHHFGEFARLNFPDAVPPAAGGPR